MSSTTLDRRARREFENVVQMEPSDREDYLTELDTDLGNRVRQLLSADHEASPFLSEPVLLASMKEVGSKIGAYRLVERIGSGGSSVVFRATRDTGEFQQDVAIKLLRIGMDSKAARRRFKDERVLLASLEHPWIARLLDGGTLSDGTPYLVMEYVRGSSILEYCDTNRLSVDERLELFLAVCDAVEFAHRSLVIHRDLKPANILITEDGFPKLLDFGIAKLIEPASSGGPTATHSLVMTPAFASPEQLTGEATTTATDLYSLGVVLFELLSDLRPYELETPDLFRRAHLIRGRIPRSLTSSLADGVWRPDGSRPPSTEQLNEIAAARRTTPRSLRRRLAGDLDVITSTAIQPDLSARYGSVDQLAGDIRCHLAGLPIRARTAGPLYRLGKMLRRHPVASTAISLVFAALFAFAILSKWQANRIAQERHVTQQERDRAEAMTRFLVDAFEVVDPMLGEQREDLSARDLVDGLTQQLENEPGIDSTLRADLLRTAGILYRNLGLYDDSLRLLTSALELQIALRGEEDLEISDTREALAALHVRLGNHDQAKKLAQLALASRETALGLDHPSLSSILSSLGAALYLEGDFSEAELVIRRGIDLGRRANPVDAESLADSLAMLGVVSSTSGGGHEAIEPLREAVALARSHLHAEHPKLASHLSNLGTLLFELGELDEAEPALREAMKITSAAFGPDHPEVGAVVNNLALVLHQKALVDGDEADLVEAESHFREALRIAKTSLGDKHRDLPIHLNNLALVLEDQGRLKEAEELFHQALEIGRLTAGTTPDLGKWLNNFAYFMFHRRHESTAALALWKEALDVYRATVGEQHPSFAMTLSNYASALSMTGDPHGAVPLLRTALATRSAILPGDHPGLAHTSLALADALTWCGDFAEAEALAKRALEVYESIYPETHWRLALARGILGASLGGNGRTDEAKPLLDESLAALRAARGRESLLALVAERRLSFSMADPLGDLVER